MKKKKAETPKKAPARSATDEPQPGGVFLVDDHETFESAVRGIIGSNPHRDLVFCGFAKNNSPGLVDEVRRSKAVVVLVDVLLGYGDHALKVPTTSGVAAIRAIRAAIRANTLPHVRRLIGTSNDAEYSRRAIEAGADDFIAKRAKVAAYTTMLRYWAGFDVVPVPTDMGYIRGIDFFDAQKAIVVHGTVDSTDPIPLSPVNFGFLRYLAQEKLDRARQDHARQDHVDQDYVQRRIVDGHGQFAPADLKLWGRLAGTTGVDRFGNFSSPPSVWRTQIHNVTRGLFSDGDLLISGPEDRGNPETYHLSLDASQIILK